MIIINITSSFSSKVVFSGCCSLQQSDALPHNTKFDEEENFLVLRESPVDEQDSQQQKQASDEGSGLEIDESELLSTEFPQKPLSERKSECGQTPIKPEDTRRIVGGYYARPYSWPWQAQLCMLSQFLHISTETALCSVANLFIKLIVLILIICTAIQTKIFRLRF